MMGDTYIVLPCHVALTWLAQQGQRTTSLLERCHTRNRMAIDVKTGHIYDNFTIRNITQYHVDFVSSGSLQHFSHNHMGARINAYTRTQINMLV